MRDDLIKTEDTPKVRDWSHFRRGMFSRPEQENIKLSLNANVISSLKS